MTLRISYILGLIACSAVGLTSFPYIDAAHAETLKITGPNGEVKQQAKRQYGPTTSRDTFWSIAQKVRPNDRVSVYQVMAAVFDANPHAFSGNNYNTLERGMILLIPSADVMAAIPDSVARRRAEQDDRQIARQTPQPRIIPKPVVNKPAPIIEVVKKPNADQPLQIAQQAPAVKPQPQAAKQADSAEIKDLNSAIDKANTKTLMLTDELARVQDELMVSNNDNQALKNKIGQMNLNISSLEEDLQLLNEKHDKLTIEYEKLLQQVGDNTVAPVVEEPTDFWRSLMDNTMLLIAAASLPLLLIFGFIFWLLTRRNKTQAAVEEQEAKQPEAAAKQAESPAQDVEVDDENDLVIHLDDDDDESIDDLLNLDSAELRPEASLANDTEMDLADDVFATEDENNDGSSLDDLWAEAMEEQDSDLEPLNDDDDLDSLLAGLDDEPAAKLSSTAPEDDLDSLLAGLDGDDASDNDALDASAENDIDSLLAEFDMPAETESDKTQAAESEPEPELEDEEPEAEPEAETVSNDDDIDSLLAEFDMPAETESDETQAAETESEPEPETVSNDDDIDSLLAEFDMPAETESDETQAAESESEPELEDEEPEASQLDEEPEPETVSNDDDIDSLLAEFDMPAETESDETQAAEAESEPELEDEEPEAEPEAEQTSELDQEPETELDTAEADDDITDQPTSTDDDTEQLSTELDDENEQPSDDDIDSLLAGLAAIPEDKDQQLALDDGEEDDLASLIAAELEDDSDEQNDGSVESDDDIDALLASLNEPVTEPETTDVSDVDETEADDEDLAAQIAAELEDESDTDSEADSVLDDTEPSDDDIDALLAGLDEPLDEPSDEPNDELSNEPSDVPSHEPVTEATSAEQSDDTQADDEDLAAQIAAELEDEDLNNIAANISDSSDDDIDALLASFNEPQMDSPFFQEDAQGVAPKAEPAELDDDVEALLASFEQEVEDDDAQSSLEPQQDVESELDSLEDQDLFNELDEYLNDLDLNNTEDNDDDASPELDGDDKSFLDAELDALLAQSDSDDTIDDALEESLEDTLEESLEESGEVVGSDDTDKQALAFELEDAAIETPEADDTSEDELNALLASMGDDDVTLDDLDFDNTDAPSADETPQHSAKANKDSGFFNDLKANKPKPAMLDWESDLFKAAETAAKTKSDELNVSDDDLLAAFSQSLKEDDTDDYTSEDDFILSDDNLTVDEALAALDEKERSKFSEYSVSDDDLMSFERENGYIDIDKLLNDADEDDDRTDQYKDVDVDMGEVNSLIGNADMIDVDDEENSVNAKLDLARAYIEIEDQDSAKALLKEVQMDGNDRQKAEADSLLKGFR
ncbi:FimV/HubP family polar landmark protein [Shewanella inventionis]|uniref:FimV/HubP family polar landmark protein n=1 Tax=Shewanella inventionis TaxID=1738770 RepID=UPI0020104217|nr:FimV/HubP family polar landmark protein [Shewanella inventionis]MCL1160114.1 hypothetical protein [Shewanella inventionis]